MAHTRCLRYKAQRCHFPQTLSSQEGTSEVGGWVLTKHDGTRTVVGVEQGNAYLVAGLELDVCWRLEEKWLLYVKLVRFPMDLPMTYQSSLLMLVGQLLLLEYSLLEIDARRTPLQL